MRISDWSSDVCSSDLRQDHQAYLREHPDMIPLATEEFLRAYAAVTTFRICVKEIEIAGVRVMPGDRVAMSTTLAGRDEGKYDKPKIGRASCRERVCQ